MLKTFKSNGIPNLINWTYQFRIEGLLGGKSQCHSNFKSILCMQAVRNLIRRHVVWRLICFCMDSLKRTPGVYELKSLF